MESTNWHASDQGEATVMIQSQLEVGAATAGQEPPLLARRAAARGLSRLPACFQH